MRSVLRPHIERTATLSDPTANAVAVGLLKSPYSRSKLAVYSLSTVGRFAFRVQHKNTAIRCDLCFGVTARRRLGATTLRLAATDDDLKSP